MKRLLGLALLATVVVIGASLVHNHYYLNIAVFAGFNALLAIGLNLLLGLAGQVSLGHAAFYALGAYGVGILSVLLHWPVWLSLPAAMALTGAAAFIIGLPTLRLHGHYLALATLGFGLIVQVLLVEIPSLTGGPSGMSGIPPLSFGPLTLGGDRAYVVLVWLIILLVQAGLGNLRRSRMGRALLAIHDSETAAASLGVDTGREKRAVFVLSAVLAALAGGLYACYINFISPETFGFGLSVQVLTMSVVGGLGTLWGPVIGALVLTTMPEFLRLAKDFDTILYGLLLVFCIGLLPDGIAGGLNRLLHEKRRPIQVSLGALFAMVGGLLDLFLGVRAVLALAGRGGQSLDRYLLLGLPLLAGMAILMVSAFGMLRGLGWARLLYIVLQPVALSMAMLCGGINSIVVIFLAYLVFYGLPCGLLATPSARGYFRGNPASPSMAR